MKQIRLYVLLPTLLPLLACGGSSPSDPGNNGSGLSSVSINASALALDFDEDGSVQDDLTGLISDPEGVVTDVQIELTEGSEIVELAFDGSTIELGGKPDRDRHGSYVPAVTAFLSTGEK